MPNLSVGVVTSSDEDLIGMARAGEGSAREELFRRHFGMAYRVAFRLLGHEQDALDAVQDGMLKAVLHLGDFDGRSGFRTWLLRIVTNAALDVGRRRRRRPWVSLEEEGPRASFSQFDVAASSNGHDPAAGLLREDLGKEIRSALDKLSPSTRTTFVLYAEAQLSYKEVAECQGVPIGTVMSRIHYARQKLQAHLDGVTT